MCTELQRYTEIAKDWTFVFPDNFILTCDLADGERCRIGGDNDDNQETQRSIRTDDSEGCCYIKNECINHGITDEHLIGAIIQAFDPCPYWLAVLHPGAR